MKSTYFKFFGHKNKRITLEDVLNAPVESEDSIRGISADFAVCDEEEAVLTVEKLREARDRIMREFGRV